MWRLFLSVWVVLLFIVSQGTCQIPVHSGVLSSAPGKTSLSNPWTGGMNACQFCEIDLNLDGTSDILVFDRHGNRIMPMIRQHPGETGFTYNPLPGLLLPRMEEWVRTVDFNCDGKSDLFTYHYGGIRVYENISDSALKFRLRTNMVESWYYNGFIGILVTSVDYPSIADVDGDGDLDILTFFGLGSYVEYHRNMSMERFGHCDSLDFRLEDPCWGKFRESETGNRITLNISCTNDDNTSVKPKNGRHTGSTLTLTDLNQDGLQDLILGDYGFPNLIALYNGGTAQSALIVSLDTLFPPDHPVNLFSFPSVSLADADGDGFRDLIIAPYDPDTATSNNYRCAWYFRNDGTGLASGYQFRNNSFLRDQMLDFGSGSFPLLQDLDQDGLTDLLVGNNGYYDTSWFETGFLKSSFISRVAWLRNTGTKQYPFFTGITDDLAGLSALHKRGLYPSVYDWDQDGIADLVSGCSDGTLIFSKGSHIDPDTAIFVPPVLNWHGIDVGENSTPACWDLDKDLLPDLIIGERNGNLNWYRNTGTAGHPEFTLATDSLGYIDVTNHNLSYFGFSTPAIFSGPDGETLLSSGSDDGVIYLYGQIDQNPYGRFRRIDTLYQWISGNPTDTLFGRNTSPAFAYLYDSLHPDLITGNFSGGLRTISKNLEPQVIPGITIPPLSTRRNLVFPNPADKVVTIIPPFEQDNINTLKIFNLTGNCLITKKVNGTTTLDISGLPEGLYILQTGNQTSKIVIIHQKP
jgi:hypothetical protein